MVGTSLAKSNKTRFESYAGHPLHLHWGYRVFRERDGCPMIGGFETAAPIRASPLRSCRCDV